MTAEPLDVDGARPAVEWVAALPRDWTTPAERLVLYALACDSFDGCTSRPGLENLAQWTGMYRSSVAAVVKRLLKSKGQRPALLASSLSKGKSRSEYRLLQPSGESDSSIATKQTFNRPAKVTVSSPSTVVQLSHNRPAPQDAPLPLPEKISLSPFQRAVAKALGLKDDDERLQSVDKMLKDNGAYKPMGFIQTCSKNGTLGPLLDDSHAPVKREQIRVDALKVKTDLTWDAIVDQLGSAPALALRNKCESDLQSSYPQLGIPPKILFDAIQVELREMAV